MAKQQGALIIFPSFVLHEVMPVKRYLLDTYLQALIKMIQHLKQKDVGLMEIMCVFNMDHLKK
jgi:predicted 2-oxoglutarate/Fe(II)-dependent dioxygenase YbiX